MRIDRPANAAALGELTFGDAAEARVLLYVDIGSEIGCALVVDGRILRGGGDAAGEFGHMLVAPEYGPICECGNRGCLATVASGAALCRVLQPLNARELSPALVAELATRGDTACRRQIAQAGRMIGRQIGNLCNCVNPDLVVVGGELAAAGELLLEPIRVIVRQTATAAVAQDARVVRGGLGERAPVLGALALAASESDGQPGRLHVQGERA